MYQNNRGSYRSQPSMVSQFFRSCLGKIVIAAAVFVLLLLIAFITRPSDEDMRAGMLDNIRQSIESPDSLVNDGFDVFLNNLSYTFTEAGPDVKQDLLNNFKANNQLIYYNDHAFYQSVHLFNNYEPTGIRCGLGIFGLVIPLVNFNNYLLREGPGRAYYDNPLVEDGYNDDLGENPALQPFLYKGE